MNEQRLITELQQLPKSIQPPRDPWAEIEAKLDSRRSRRWIPLSLVAALIGAIAIGIAIREAPTEAVNANGVQLPVAAAPDDGERLDDQVDDDPVDGAPMDAMGGGAGHQYATFLDTEYAGALRELKRAQIQDLQTDQSAPGDEEKDAELRAAFADIAAAQKRLRERLDEDPDNLQLASLLALTHRQQARSLRALTTTETSS